MMNDASPTMDLAAAGTLALRAIARLLPEFGLTQRGCSEPVRRVFVDVESSGFCSCEPPANPSQGAILTGVSRRAGARLRAEAVGAPRTSTLAGNVAGFREFERLKPESRV